MAKRFGGSFSRRGPDVLAEELAVVLCGKTAFAFKPLFTLVHANLRARKLASGGEDMLRLRLYEKLQELVQRGLVETTSSAGVKEYSGLASLAGSLPPLAGALPAPPVVAEGLVL